MKKQQLIIVKNKKTSRMAASFSNMIATKYEVPQMYDESYDLSLFSNQTRFLILSEKTMKEHLSDSSIKPKEISDGVFMIRQGYKVGIYCNPDFDFKSYIIPSSVIAITMGAFPFLSPITGLIGYLKLRSKTERKKAVCLAAGLLKFKDNYLDNYMNDL